MRKYDKLIETIFSRLGARGLRSPLGDVDHEESARKGGLFMAQGRG